MQPDELILRSQINALTLGYNLSDDGAGEVYKNLALTLHGRIQNPKMGGHSANIQSVTIVVEGGPAFAGLARRMTMNRRSFFASVLALAGLRLATPRKQEAALYVQDDLGSWQRIATVRPEFQVRINEWKERTFTVNYADKAVWTPPHILR